MAAHGRSSFIGCTLTEKNYKAEDLKVNFAKLRNVVHRKASKIKEIMNEVDALQACELNCLECTSKGEVENYKEDIVVEKEELIIKKDIKNKEILREKNMKINKQDSTV